MTILEMLGQSAVLTVLGVTIVFSFLFIVVVVVSQFERVFKPRGKKAITETTETTNKAVNPQIVAAISAAIVEYRKSN